MSKERLTKGYLKWRCRRGTKELDVMLTGFLEANFETLNDQELRDFDELLNTQDTILWYWLSGQESAEQTPVAEIVGRIYAHHH